MSTDNTNPKDAGTDTPSLRHRPFNKKPYIIVLGNQKGGTGKSTLAMHIITHLLRSDLQVASIDVDCQQGTLTQYINNRKISAKQQSAIRVPEHFVINQSQRNVISEAQAEEEEKFEATLQQLQQYDFIVIDTPGHKNYLSGLAHSYADTIITPVNDSFIDLDVLMQVDRSAGEPRLVPGVYANMVWEQKKRRALRNATAINWILVRNRLPTIHSKNNQAIQAALEAIAPRLGIKLAPGFTERVIFRELFNTGLTVFDLEQGNDFTLSHLAAKYELLDLLKLIEVPALKQAVNQDYQQYNANTKNQNNVGWSEAV